MDTVTHIVLGACIGEAIGGRRIGKKALLLGAIGQSLPDIDFVNGIWLDTCDDLLAHRGYTHSLMFVLLVTPFLALLSRYIWKRRDMSYKLWLFFWGAEVFVHIFLDAFNAYGTGWFEPFSQYRVSFNTMFVADPLFSIWLAIAAVALMVIKHDSQRRKHWVIGSIALCTTYLIIGILFKLHIDNKLEKQFDSKHLGVKRYFTTPTFFNNILWYAVAETDSGYYTGYRSVFDKEDTVPLRYVSRNAQLLSLSDNEKDKATLLRFSQGYYTAELWHDTLVFNVLRFGEINGWMEPKPRFAFYYYLQYPKENDLIVQRGRFANWDADVLRRFLDRMGGTY
ncbi:MAG: metal-dependent hydrolase [Bacteroidota bacterium]